jgi:hypothetical protein
MTSTVREFPITDEIQELGFSRIYRRDRNLIMHNSNSIIHSRYFPSDLDSTLHHLEKKLTEYDKIHGEYFGKEKIQRFLTLFAEMDIRSDEAEDEAINAIAVQQKIEKERIIEEIEQLKAAHSGIASKEWQAGLVEKFDVLRNVVENNIPELWPGLEFELSVLRILNIHRCTLPFIGIILGRPAGGKTQVISLLRKWPYAYYTDIFTAKSFVSHSTAVKQVSELMSIDMLPRIKNKAFCTPEWAPIFTAKEDELKALLGIVTRIADGQGLSSDSGVHGHRSYEGTHMLVWIGAAVDVPYNVYKVLSSLGPKLYFFRLPFKEGTVEDVAKEIGEDFSTKYANIETALFDYLKWFELGPELVCDDNPDDEQQENDKYKFNIDTKFNQFKFSDAALEKKWIEDAAKERQEHDSGISPTTANTVRLSKLEWDRKKDNREAIDFIAQMAVLLSHLRCEAKTWHTSNTEDTQQQGYDFAYSANLPEHPKRAGDVFLNLARGHALLFGRNFITLEDIPIVIKTMLSTAHIERVKLFSLLLAHNGTLTTSKIIESLDCSDSTARRTMTEFKAIGLVSMESVTSSHEKCIILKDKFSWFLSDAFKQLREGFEATDYGEWLKEKGSRASKTTDYKSAFGQIQLFDNVFEELANKHEPLAMTVDKGTVGHHELVGKLVSTEKFSRDDADAIIADMIELGKIELVMLNTYRRKHQENISK